MYFVIMICDVGEVLQSKLIMLFGLSVLKRNLKNKFLKIVT